MRIRVERDTADRSHPYPPCRPRCCRRRSNVGGRRLLQLLLLLPVPNCCRCCSTVFCTASSRLPRRLRQCRTPATVSFHTRSRIALMSSSQRLCVGVYRCVSARHKMMLRPVDIHRAGIYNAIYIYGLPTKPVEHVCSKTANS